MKDLFALFLLYSFLGFLVEVVYTRLIGHSKRDRKCLLLLPLCPVYGLGAAAILALPAAGLARPVGIFLVGGLAATGVEYLTALFYEKGVGVRFWEYDDHPGNLGGRVCPLYTLFWGLLALALVYGLHPLLGPLALGLPLWAVRGLFLVFSADALLSLVLLHKTGTTDCLLWYKGKGPLAQGGAM